MKTTVYFLYGELDNILDYWIIDTIQPVITNWDST